MRKLALSILVPLGACTSVAPSTPVQPSNVCLPATLDQFIGQRQGKDLGARMLQLTGKTVLRWVEPGMAVTMDYREDRLTAYLDAARRVERVSCG